MSGLFPAGHLRLHPLPPAVAGALGLGGYQLLAEVAGVGAGRLGSHAFLLVAAEPEPPLSAPAIHVALHRSRIREEAEVATFTQLAAQLGYLRLSGYRLVPERAGMRSKIAVVDPGSGSVAAIIPERHPGSLLRGGGAAAHLLSRLRSVPPAGRAADPDDPELMRQVLVALALQDEELTGAQAVEVAERALDLVRGEAALDPPAALQAAKQAPP